jgi:phosphoribosyl-ATP pyrophosphohydrolase/phosphoribosyl-AMP cyclohydrolase
MSSDPDFSKCDGLLPAIVQHADSARVLMLGYMNQEAYECTKREKRVTFFSRSRKSLWLKGETSGSFLNVVSMEVDCDQDSILVRVVPEGPVCHTGTESCFGSSGGSGISFLDTLSQTIAARAKHPKAGSYTTELLESGVDRMAQKVGEEAIEVVIAAKNTDNEKLLGEAADLVYHLLVLLESRGLSLGHVVNVLKRRAPIPGNSTL